MRVPPQAALLPDGRLHLQHGPMDLVIEALDADTSHSGRGSGTAYRAAASRFTTVLDELCAELPQLRRPAHPHLTSLRGAIATRMWAAVAPFSDETFITPMAAVAGAVAEEVLAAMMGAADLARAAVNNGGDIAVHLAPGESLRIGLVDGPEAPALIGSTTIEAVDAIGGVATSGWRGRSFSLGIADAVTVLARTAAEADAAATIVANAVDLPGHPAVTRCPARDIQADSDLVGCPVTRGVGPLTAAEIGEALAAGLAKADELVARGLMRGAALHLQGTTAATGGAFSDPSKRNSCHAEEAGAAGGLEARGPAVACFEPRSCGPLLSMMKMGHEDMAA